MKKLALASVAFAGITALGGGDAFATGVLFDTASSFPSNDTATWVSGPGGANTVATVHNVAAGSYSVSTSVTSTHGVKVTDSYRALLGANSSNSLYYGIQNGGHNLIQNGFPDGASVLYGTTSGSMNIGFAKPVKGAGFYVSPILGTGDDGLSFFVFAEVFGKTTGGSTDQLLASDAIGGVISTGCTASACTFLAPVVTGANIVGMTQIHITVNSGTRGECDPCSLLPPGISSVLLDDAASKPVPEPATLSILGAGLLGLGAMRRRRGASNPETLWQHSPFGRWRVAGIPPDRPTT